MSAPPVIRLGTPDDAPGVALLLNAVIAEGAPVLVTGPFSDDEEHAFLAALPARGGFHVAVEPHGGAEAQAGPEAHGGTPPATGAAPVIVAAQVFAPYAGDMPAHDHVAVMGTWVLPAWRRHGLGCALSERTFALARSRGFTKVFTDVRADNLDSLAFHLALGFSVAGAARGQAIVAGRSYDVVFIERRL